MNMMTSQWVKDAENLPFDALVQLALRIADEPKPMPPAWLIAPSFRIEGDEGPVAGAQVPPAGTAPYRSIREVPRAF